MHEHEHEWFQLHTHIGRAQGGTDSYPPPVYLGRRKDDQKQASYRYAFLVMCRRCTEIRKVEYEDR